MRIFYYVETVRSVLAAFQLKQDRDLFLAAMQEEYPDCEFEVTEGKEKKVGTKTGDTDSAAPSATSDWRTSPGRWDGN